MSSDDGASTRIREHGGGNRYAHERVARRKRGRLIRLASGTLTVGAVAALVVLVAERTADLVPLGPVPSHPTQRLSDTAHPLPFPTPLFPDPSPFSYDPSPFSYDPSPFSYDPSPFSPDSASFLLDPASFLLDPTPFLLVAGIVRDALLIVAGLATGVVGCLLCIAAIRVRGWRHGGQPPERL